MSAEDGSAFFPEAPGGGSRALYNWHAVWLIYHRRQDSSPDGPLLPICIVWKRKSLSCVRLFVTPVDYTLRKILQARILEWVAIPFSRGSSQPGDRTQVSYIAGRFLTRWTTREALYLPWSSHNSQSQAFWAFYFVLPSLRYRPTGRTGNSAQYPVITWWFPGARMGEGTVREFAMGMDTQLYLTWRTSKDLLVQGSLLNVMWQPGRLGESGYM